MLGKLDGMMQLVMTMKVVKIFMALFMPLSVLLLLVHSVLLLLVQ
jgi:hypothetical protein